MQPVTTPVEIQNIFTPAKNFSTIGSLVTVVLKNAFVLAGVIAFILLILGGFGIIVGAGSGDTKKLEEGKKTLTTAVIGLILIIASVWIIQVVETLTGLKGQLVPFQ